MLVTKEAPVSLVVPLLNSTSNSVEVVSLPTGPMWEPKNTVLLQTDSSSSQQTTRGDGFATDLWIVCGFLLLLFHVLDFLAGLWL